jgi:hypothetical protein
MTDRKSASLARQSAMKTTQDILRIVRRLVAQQKEITPGKITRLKVKCGKKGCRCAQGERHDAVFLYVSKGGPLRRIWLPKDEIPSVTEKSERYRRFRADRVALGKSLKTLLAQINRLEDALSVPYEKTS